MTDGQKEKRIELEKVFRADPKGVGRSFARIASDWLTLLSDSGSPSLTLWTDEKRDYSRALEGSPCVSALLGLERLAHRTVSSRAARTRENPLFPVNYMDREIRKDLHEHVRETSCGGRNVSSQMERLTLYLLHHNYLKPFRISLPQGPTHAEVAGYDLEMTQKELGKLWVERAWLTHTDLGESARETWLRQRKTPLKAGREYIQKHVWGWIRGGIRDLSLAPGG